ncbi:FAD-dependent oxidoreductase [Nocardioides sp. NBC_00850]|uniref:FAD-dependent oxidoreductase n=1 Tax=Nocardioides sp. NBC_00850 TaxID=2976001 RepID=UPI003869E62B|nr:FAD-dependent oxidoreductase [Nocardioides sp. NBC_00850]
MRRKRVIIAGLGETGVLTAVRLSKHADVVGISTKPGLISGQELGARLSRPAEWERDYRISFDRFRGLDRADAIHGTLVGLDLAHRAVHVERPDGTTRPEPYDLLVISTGVTNGFWRIPGFQTDDQIDADLQHVHQQLQRAASVIVIGGGAAAVSSAANISGTWPDKQVDLYYPGEHPLPQHHRRTWQSLEKRLVERGVGLHLGHRAELPPGFVGDEITSDAVTWSTGQPPAKADAVLWAIGRVHPNTGWLPAEILDDRGFVVVDPNLQVKGQSGVFAVGDVAATDELRSSARNRADRLLARNIKAVLKGKPLGSYQPPRRRWGSVIGVQRDGLQVFAPNGRPFRFPAWTINTVLQPWIVRWGIYKGVRRGRG